MNDGDSTTINTLFMTLRLRICSCVMLLLAAPLFGAGAETLKKSHISFYPAQLVCPAVPDIGCGSAAKPILLSLERDPQVSQAWLNRHGTVLAVVWKEHPSADERARIVQTALDEPKLRELKGFSREQSLKSFLNGRDWFRGEAVDRLSSQEAAINAGKLARKIQQLVSLPSDKAAALQQAITPVLERKLIQGQSREETEAAIIRICREQLEPKDLAVLKRAYDEGAFARFSPNSK